MEDQAEVFLYYIAKEPPYTTTSILKDDVVGIEYFHNRNGTVCRFYDTMEVIAVRGNQKLEYRPNHGTYKNNVFLHRYFNAKLFADFWLL